MSDNPTTGHWEGNQWCPHADNPTTSSSAKATADRGEWTVDTVRGLLYEDLSEETGVSNVMDAHNATLAAAWRKGHADAQEPALKRIDELHQQLAAEREKSDAFYADLMESREQVQTLRDALTNIRLEVTHVLEPIDYDKPVQLAMINEDPVITLK